MLPKAIVIALGFLAIWIVLSGIGLCAQPATAPATQPARPALGVHVSIENADTGNYAGWPLILLVDLTHPDRDAGELMMPAITLTSSTGKWPDAVKLTVTDAGKHTATWPLHLLTKAAGPGKIDAGNYLRAGFCLSPDETAQLAPGDYTVTATVDGIRTPAGPRSATSVPITIHLQKPPAVLNVDQGTNRQIILSEYHWLNGDKAAAMADVKGVLGRHPDDMKALILSGDLLMDAGKPRDALDVYDHALSVVKAQAKGKHAEPPRILLAKRKTAMNAIIDGK